MKILYNLLFFICFSAIHCLAQNIETRAISIDKIPDAGILSDNWKFHAGDRPEWAIPAIDDRNWDNINPSSDYCS